MNNTRFVIYGLALAIAITITAAAQDTNVLPAKSQAITQGAGTYDELKELLKDRYDGKLVAPIVSGLYAGVHEKNFLGGPGSNGIIWSHFAANMQVPNRVHTGSFEFPKASDMNQLDDHTFGGLSKGLNVSQIQKDEPLKVYKFYVYPEYVEFVLSTTGLGHLNDVDYNKASKEATTVGNQTTVAVGTGFGFLFRFYFNKGLIKDDHDYAAIVSEINKYLLPQSEAKALATSKQNIEIEPGMTEDQVFQKLGQPLQAVKFGDQKTLKY